MKKPVLILFVILAIVFLAVAVYYWVTPAGKLVHFVPGYAAGSTHKHLKHGFAALIVAVGCGIVAWFGSGNKNKSSSKPASSSNGD